MENFKDIPNYEGLYSISNTGIIKDVIKNKLVNAHDNGKGYLKASLVNKEGYRKYWYVHKLVILTFNGFEKDKHVDHIDGNRQNNNITNLRYVTPRQNVQKGRFKNPASKLIGVAKDGVRWRSTITIDKVRYFLGRFDSDVEGHNAYIKALNDWENKGIKPTKC